MGNSGEILHVLLLSADPLLVTAFAGISNELGIEAESTEDSRELSLRINRAKYEGVIVDFDTVADARPALASVRESRSNRDAILFAVATNTKQMKDALEDRAHFLLRRPVTAAEIKRTLNSAHDLMLGERRRHFRCAATLPVRLTMSSGATVDGSTMNVSSNGMAVMTSTSLRLGEILNVQLQLPDSLTVQGTGVVIWDDKHGKSGLSFQCSTVEMRRVLNSWLDSQFAQSRFSICKSGPVDATS